MSEALKAVEELQQFANRFKPLFELEKTLTKLGNLEQVEKEIQSRVDSVREIEVEANASCAKAEDKLRQVQDRIAETKADALKTEEDAKVRANEIIEMASKESRRIVAEAKETKAKIEEEILKVKTEISYIRTEFETYDAALKVIKKECAEMKARISAVRV